MEVNPYTADARWWSQYTALARVVIDSSTRYFSLCLKLKVQTSWLKDRDQQTGVLTDTTMYSVASQETSRS